MLISQCLFGALVAAIAWGVLAFGAVYPWAYVPLAVACAAIGVAGLLAGQRGRPPISRLAIGLVAIGVAVSLQLVPLPRPVLARVSPGTDVFLRQYDFRYMHPTGLESVRPAATNAAAPWQPVSINPAKTAVGLLLFSALALFLLGAARNISALGARGVGMAALALGILLTVLAMIQLALNPNAREFTLIYGFWRPRGVSMPFGPFVNPNHYAGWMLMALPLVLGLGYGAFERARLSAPPHVKSPAAWALSREGGLLVLSAFACLAMGASLMMTKSRSGIACMAVATVLAGGMVALRQRRASAKAAVAAAFAILFLGTVAWAGVDTMLEKFQTPQGGLSASGRLDAWKDTVRIIRDHPVTGTGFDTYVTAMVMYQTARRGEHFEEAHNDYLQLAAEGGLLVGIPVLFTLVAFITEVRRRFREAPKEGTTYWLRVGAVVGLVSIALQSIVEFSLQMPGNAAFFAVLAAVALHRAHRLGPRTA